jgi:hypothetical protein
MHMTKRSIGTALAASLLLVATIMPAKAWDREHARTFAVLPAGSSGPEGLTVGPDGNIYVTTFGFNSAGAVTGTGQLFVYASSGKLLRQVAITGSSVHLLGLAFNPATRGPQNGNLGDLIVLDFGAGKALKVNPVTGAASVFMTAPVLIAAGPGLNGLTFDRLGNVYISDSFQGVIWKTGPAGGTPTQWVNDPLLRTTGVPPFGANGIEFNHAGDTAFIANTGDDTVISVPVLADGSAGQPAIFVNSINGADGIAIDAHDNLWVAANQADEMVVVNPQGKAIAKLGDFNGITDKGEPNGLLFPASPAFSLDGAYLYVTNLALDITVLGMPQAVDSQWAHQVNHYTIARIPTRLPVLPDGNDD